MAVAAEDHSFTPSNASLVDRYLRRKVAGGQISDDASACFFNDADVCSARPYDLVRDRTPARVPCRDAGDGMQWFFFSPARCGGKRRSRTIDGTSGKESWHSEGSAVAVEGSAAGGFVQKFSYHVRPAPGVVEKPGWIMAEYSVVKETRAGDLVLCKVYKSPRGPGRSRAPSSSANSGCKRKAMDDEEHVEAATPSTRPRLTDEDDVMVFADDIERDLLSHEDHMAAPEFMERQHVEESQPEPQLAPAAMDGKMSFDEIEAIMMADVEDDETTLRVPDGEDPVTYYMRVLGLSSDDQQPLDDAFIQTVHGPCSESEVIAAIASGVTVDELLLDGPLMSCPHPDGAFGLLCA
ncbi:hypothetical protein EJB05_11249, partial [Eragrostis curvula]